MQNISNSIHVPLTGRQFAELIFVSIQVACQINFNIAARLFKLEFNEEIHTKFWFELNLQIPSTLF
jgi:hypothetical protein